MNGRRRWGACFLFLLFLGAEVFAYAPQLHGHEAIDFNRAAHRGPGAVVPNAPSGVECAACHLLTISASLTLTVIVSAPALAAIGTSTLTRDGEPSIDGRRPSGRAPPAR